MRSDWEPTNPYHQTDVVRILLPRINISIFSMVCLRDVPCWLDLVFFPHWILLNVEIFRSWSIGFLEATGEVSPDRTLTSSSKGDLDRFMHFLNREKSWATKMMWKVQILN